MGFTGGDSLHHQFIAIDRDQGFRSSWSHDNTGSGTNMMAHRTLVIVVDDDPALLKSLVRLLARESGSVATATCLLLDMHLGGMSGMELERRFAALGSKYPVIFMSANDREHTCNRAMDAGSIACLRKPFRRLSC
ncbi:FixJ family two-component response regulator [Bradyrhizobium sp. LB1.3]